MKNKNKNKKKQRLQGLEKIRKDLKEQLKCLRKQQKLFATEIENIKTKHESWIRNLSDDRKPQPLSQKKQKRIASLSIKVRVFQEKIEDKISRISDIEWAIKCLRIAKF